MSDTPPNPQALPELLAAAEQLDTLRKYVHDQLRGGRSLVDVAREVAGTQGLSDSQWLSLGIAADVLASFTHLEDAQSFMPRPTAEGLTLLPEHACAPLAAVRMQLPGLPRSVSVGLKVLRDVLRALDPDIEVSVLLRPGSNAGAMQRLLARWDVPQSRRVRFVHHGSKNLFAQDNAKTALLDGGRVLLLPRDDQLHREYNRLDPEGLHEALGLPVVHSRLYWDGGNLLYDGHRVLVGANSVALNCLRLGLSEAQVRAAFEAELGAQVLVLGDVSQAIAVSQRQRPHAPYRIEGGQADFHIDLDVCPLGRLDGGAPAVAIADPQAGLAHMEAVRRHPPFVEEHFLPPDDMAAVLAANFQRTAKRRAPLLQSYAQTLTEAGYELVPIPDLRVSPSDSYVDRINVHLNYVNAVPQLSAQGPVVYLWHYGVGALDEAADQAYRDAGIAARVLGTPSTAHETLHLMGGPHCLLSKLA